MDEERKKRGRDRTTKTERESDGANPPGRCEDEIHVPWGCGCGGWKLKFHRT